MIRLLGEEAWRILDELRGERRTGRSARMLYEVLGDIWVVRRNPYLQDDLLENPKRREMLISALHHRLAEIEKRRAADRAEHAEPAAEDRSHRVEQLVTFARQAIEEFKREFTDAYDLRKRAARAGPRHAERQHQVRRALARVARDRRHRLARRISVRGADPPTARKRSPGWSRAASNWA
ncbi:DUF3683 domain-containing protein [Cupriavidus sp. H18C1]|uniref:DUF3683 domain-containing protein n=1 Tax=Cupriavidus sp. H18C1 TaxID=3241601 RepID=UPI003BB9911E